MIDLLMCSNCKDEKPISEFHKQRNTTRGYNYSCKDCTKKMLRDRYARLSDAEKARRFEKQKAHRQQNKTRYRGHWLKYNYGLSLSDYENLLVAQNYVCAICGTDDPGQGKSNFCVDHDHACCAGTRSCGDCIRGLLCTYCNHGLGSLRDSPTILKSAIAYLESA